MSQISSEKPTRYFNFSRKHLSRLIIFLLIILFVFCLKSIHPTEILTPDDLPPELMRKIEEAVNSFKKPLPDKEYKGIVSTTEKETQKVLNPGKDEGDYLSSESVYYFFSFSMPEEVILGAMRDAIKVNREGKEKVSLILRGFVKNDLRVTIEKLYKYLQKVGDDIPVEIEPELFDGFGVKAVPQIIKVRNDEMGVIKGDLVSIPYAISRFRDELRDYGLFGRLYPIEEENALRVFESKQKEIEKRLREVIPEIRSRMVVLNRYDGLFEHANEDRVYYIDPRVVLEDDIYDNHGNVVIPRGTIFDPTEYVKLGRYIVIDGNSKEQVEFALSGEFRKIILISGNIEKLMSSYGRAFYFANDELIERFRIRRVPVIIEGEGKYVKITEKALK